MKNFNSPSQGRRKQGGIALVTLVIFVVVLLSLLTAMVAMSRATSQSTGEQTARLLASAVLDQSNMLKAGFDLKSSLGMPISEITFSKVAGHGIFDPNKPYASRQSPPGDALISSKPELRWLYANPYRAKDSDADFGVGLGKGVKTENGIVPALLLSGVTDGVCKKINETTRNFFADGGIPTATGATLTAAAITDMEAGVSVDLDLSAASYSGIKYRDGSTAVPATTVGMGGASTGCFKIGSGTDTINVFVNLIR